MPLISCLCTEEQEIEFYVAFWRCLYIFYLVMVRAGLGPPNITVPTGRTMSQWTKLTLIKKRMATVMRLAPMSVSLMVVMLVKNPYQILTKPRPGYVMPNRPFSWDVITWNKNPDVITWDKKRDVLTWNKNRDVITWDKNRDVITWDKNRDFITWKKNRDIITWDKKDQ